jgi:hypothetical protein
LLLDRIRVARLTNTGAAANWSGYDAADLLVGDIRQFFRVVRESATAAR